MKSKSISTFSKFLSVFLSVLIVAYTIPVSVYADLINEIREMTAGTSESSDNSGGDLVVDPYELVELREENVKHFRGEDGLSVAVQYDVPVHTKNSAGRWQDIDNTLSSAGSEYATSNARIKFAKKITSNEVLFTLHDGNRKLTLSLDGAIKKTTGKAINPHTDFDESATTLQKMMTLDRLSSEITYAGILDGVDLQYVAESVHVKENIIVKKLKDSYSYTFTLKLNNLTAELCEDGSVEILDSDTSAVIYTIPAGYMFDAAGEFSDAVSYTLVPNGKNSYAFTVTADAGWINAPDRVFPVTVDPTVMTKSESDDTTDTYVDESTPNGYYNNKTFVAVGSYTGTGHDFISYWNGPMPEIPAGAYVSKVTLNYYCQNYRQNDANDPNLYIEAYPVTSSWTGKITWNQYVNKTRGTLSGTPVDYVKLTPENGTGTTFSWNITDIAKKWYDGTAEKYGIALKQNGSAKNSALLTSSDGASCNHPSVCVTYKNTFGLESYWSTLSQSAGIAGSGYVNPATGNLTITKGLLSTTDSLMPYTPNLIYNSALSGKDYEYPNVQISYWGDYMPLGFKLNIQETIIKKNYTDPENNTVAYYIWADSDGTEHSFLPVEGKSNEYRDEDGLQLVLNTANDSALTITDDSKTVKTFGKLSGTPDSTVLGGWYLTSIADKNGNTVSFTFDSGKRPTKVSLTPNGSSRIDFLTIVYNSSYMPSMIRNDSTKEAIIFRYSATPTGSITTSGTKYLRQIDYAHGNSGVTAANWTNFYNNASSKTNITLDATASYSYDAEGRIAVAKDQLSGYEVRYTYSSAGKVTAIEEYAGSTAGQKIGITYYSGYTEIRNSGSDDVYGNSDDLISCYAFDENGRSVSIYSTDASHTQIYGATAGEYES